MVAPLVYNASVGVVDGPGRRVSRSVVIACLEVVTCDCCWLVQLNFDFSVVSVGFEVEVDQLAVFTGDLGRALAAGRGTVRT